MNRLVSDAKSAARHLGNLTGTANPRLSIHNILVHQTALTSAVFREIKNGEFLITSQQNTGDAEIAAAIASNTKLAITHIAFGDGNGSVPTPNKDAKQHLIREVHRQPVNNQSERHPTNANWIVIEAIIPSNIGGFTIREMGIIANGKLISHGSHAPF